MKSNINNKKGFTLSEVLVVVALISIILLIVVPSIMLITRRINKRLFEGKKEVILAAAELYGKDNSSLFGTDPSGETEITVETLLQVGYIESDAKGEKCKEDASKTYGCIINPVDKESLNSIPIRIIKKNDTYKALWDETLAGAEVNELIKLICDKLNKQKSKTLTIDNNNSACGCEYSKDEHGNWLPNTLKLTPASGTTEPTYCYFKEEDPKNWLYYSGMDFRVMGIEKIGNDYFVKLITNDNI